MKVKIDKEACIGCGSCQAIAPEVFEIGDDGLAFVKDVEITEELEPDVIDAIEGCPTDAIIRVDEESE